MSIRVKAIRLGYYGDTRREKDEIFSIEKKEHLGKWMVPLDPLPKTKEQKPKAPTPVVETEVEDEGTEQLEDAQDETGTEAASGLV